MALHQSPVNLLAGITDRVAYSEIRDQSSLPPIDSGAKRYPEVQCNLALGHERRTVITLRHVFSDTGEATFVLDYLVVF